MELLATFWEWILAVLEHWELIVAAGAIAFILDLIDKFFEWKMPKKYYAVFVAIGLFLATFTAWREERNKVREQMAYMSIRTNEPWILAAPTENVRGRTWTNFGKENATSFPAVEEASIQKLIIEPAPFPLPEVFTPNLYASSPELEKDAWEKMLDGQENAPHYETTYDPGEKNWTSAYTDTALSRTDFNAVYVVRTSMLYLVGLEKWKSGDVNHAKSFCYWMHSPGPDTLGKPGLVVLEKCRTHHDYFANAEQYMHYFGKK